MLRTKLWNFPALLSSATSLWAKGKSLELPPPTGAELVACWFCSSLIVALIGMDILPRKEGTCTRTPLEIQIRKKTKFDKEAASSFARFEATSAVDLKDLPGPFRGSVTTPARALPQKVLPLSDDLKHLIAIRDEIEKRTNELAGPFGITPYPIVLTLVFPSAPNLRLIDLPGCAQVWTCHSSLWCRNFHKLIRVRLFVSSTAPQKGPAGEHQGPDGEPGLLLRHQAAHHCARHRRSQLRVSRSVSVTTTRTLLAGPLCCGSLPAHAHARAGRLTFVPSACSLRVPCAQASTAGTSCGTGW